MSVLEKIKKLLKHKSTGGNVRVEPDKIANESFVALDLETTGLDTSSDSILEACLLPVEGGKILVHRQLYLKIKSDQNPAKAAVIHGLLSSDGIADRHSALKEIAAYLHDKWMVGHFVGFDFEILSNQCKAFGIELKVKGLIDIQQMAIKLEKGTSDVSEISPLNYSLGNLCHKYKIPLKDEHTAAGDAFATAILFVKLFKLFRNKKYLLPITRIG